MKNLTKKRGFFAAAAALLVVTVMLGITWCSNDIGGKPDEFTPPAGKGAVRLSFNDEVARTISPGASGITSIDDFTQFQFIFEPNGSGTKWDHIVAKTDVNDPIILDPGTYDLTVIGYILESSIQVAVAGNASPVPVTIAPGKVIHETIMLRLLIDGSADGFFKYTLEESDFETGDITAATMTFTQITGGAAVAPVDIIDKFDDAPHTITLKIGIYYVKFELHVGGDTVTFTHVVHIYKGMTSTYVFSIGLNYFNAIHQFQGGNLDFDDDDYIPEISYVITHESIAGSPTQYTEGDTITLIRGDEIVFTASNSAVTYSSFEWYCLSGSSLGSTNTCTINTTAAGYPATYNLYSSERNYDLTVIGVADGIKYAIVVKFEVTTTP